MKTYLAGAINGKSDAECNDWRARFKALPGEWLDPMTRDYRGREDECMSEIVEGDKSDIDDCERVIVNAEAPSWGTAMEVLWGWLGRREIWIICPQERISPWLRYHATRIFRSVDECVSACNAARQDSEASTTSPLGDTTERPQASAQPYEISLQMKQPE